MKTILPEHFGKGILPAFFVEHWILRSTHNRRCEKKTREKNADRWKKERNYAFIYQQMWTDLQRWTEQIIKSRKIIRKYWMNGNDAWVGGTNTYTYTNCIVVRFTASSYPRLNTFFSRMFPATWALVPVNIMLKIVKHPELSAFFCCCLFFIFSGFSLRFHILLPCTLNICALSHVDNFYVSTRFISHEQKHNNQRNNTQHPKK